MKQNNPDMFIVGEIQDIIGRTLEQEWSDFLKASTSAASSTAPAPNEKTLSTWRSPFPPPRLSTGWVLR